MTLSRTGHTLNRFAALPRGALRVVGKQWDTPNLIISVHPVGRAAQQLAFSPDDGPFKWRQDVIRGENAYRRAAAWIGTPHR